MNAIKVTGTLLATGVVLGGITVLMEPAQGHVEKSIVLNAPVSAVFPEISSFKTFNKWSPFYKMDTAAVYILEGPETGVGAKMNWESKKAILGKGSLRIDEVIEGAKVKSVVTREGDSTSMTFLLTPMGDGTTMTWTYDCTNDGINGKAKWLFMDMMLNDLFEQGLSDFKDYLENKPVAAYRPSRHTSRQTLTATL